MKQVIITFGKDGSVKAEATGFKGGECMEKTAFLKQIFGEPEEHHLKPSYYEEEEKQTICGTDGLPSGWCG